MNYKHARPILVLADDMFNNPRDINCYNLVVSTANGKEIWDVEIFQRYYPRVFKLLSDHYDQGTLSFDLRGLINVSLV